MQQQRETRFGHAVTVENVRTELVDDALHRRRGDGCAASGDHPQARDVVIAEPRMMEHFLDLRRHGDQRRDALGLNRLERLDGIVVSEHDARAADHHVRNEERLHAADVIQRRDVQRDVGVPQAVLHHAVHRDRDVVDVVVHHTLGPSRRPRRVDQR